MSLEAFISVGMFFILPAAAFVIGAAGFFIRAITWRGYLVGGLSTCVVIPVGAYFLMGVLGALAQPHDGYGDRTKRGTGLDGMDIWVVSVGNALFGAAVVVLMAGLLALGKLVAAAFGRPNFPSL
ncbi:MULTISPECIES: hypothetical protein [Arthrobacter]|uniref:hypothetical protein n=2 Tax=Arthrobacter TaxID=1663 RepID=UPI0012654137|nr:hypothetical protein [Arthrobacter gandavensis]